MGKSAPAGFIVALSSVHWREAWKYGERAQLAILADARLGKKTDAALVGERPLSISGEDTITLDRKYKAAWTGKLATRFPILTNELPRLADASGALASRFVLLHMTHDFYNKENRGLSKELLIELPGILNWAIVGWHRLNEREHFKLPESSEVVMRQLEDLASPITAFVRGQCVLGTDHRIPCEVLHKAWRAWCEAQGRNWATDQATFGRDLAAACLQVKRTYPWITDDGGQKIRVYRNQGVTLAKLLEVAEPEQDEIPF